MHHDELVVTDAVARALVGAQFPAWAALPVRRITGDGTMNAIFRIGDGLTARFPLRFEDPVDVQRMLRLEADALTAVAGVATAHDPRMVDWIGRSERLVDTAAVTQVWSGLRAEPAPARLAMTHGDLTPPNLLVADAHLAGVLDGGLFGPADPALDLIAAWHLFDAPARTVVRGSLGSDDAEGRRGAGWALEQAMGLVWYDASSNPGMAALGRSTVARVLADPGLGI